MTESSHTERPSFPIGVVAFVIRDGNLLLGKRANTFGAGTWGLPAGHLEYGEDMRGAIARELFEETGLVAKELVFQSLVNQPKRTDNHYVHVAFLAQGVSGEPELREPDKCSEWRWFPLDGLPPDMFMGHTESIKAFKDGRVFVDVKD